MRRYSLGFLVILLLAAGGCWGGEDEAEATEPAATAPPVATPEPTATPVRELSWEDVVEKLEPSTVMIRSDFPETPVTYEGQGSGTGIFYSEDGYILTNAHVVSGAAALTVATAGSPRQRSARFVGISPCDDLAVIQVTDTEGLEVADLGDTAEQRVGSEVAALGYPLGEMLSLDLTFSRGAISKMNETLWEFESLIQHDAAINPGNSGGPLVNNMGEVIGVNTASVDPSVASNINFAIDINQAKRIIGDLEEGKNRGWLGMNLEPNLYPDYFGVEGGLVVAAVASGSSASNVGVQAPYLLTHLEGLTVNSMEEVCRIVRSHGDGDSLKVEFMHITETEIQYLEGEIVLGDSSGGSDLEIVDTISLVDEPATPTANGDEELTAGIWEGTASVVVDYWAPCGEENAWEMYDTQTWAHDVRVLIDGPFAGETNPFWIEVFSESEDEGGFWILSSWEYETDGLREYWEVSNTGIDVSGTLTEYRQSDAEVGNVLYSNLSVDPCSDAQGSAMTEMEMDLGTSLTGFLGAESGSLVITGMTADLYRDFSVTVDVTRVQ